MGSSASCCTTSHSTGPSPTGVKATHGAPPDSRQHRTDLLACSHTGPHRTSSDNRLPRTDPLSCSLADSTSLSRQQAAQDGLPCLQLHRTTLRISANWLLRNPNTSSQLPTPHFSWPYGQLPHRLHRTPAAQQPNTATLQHTSCFIHFPVHRLSPLLRRGVMWEHPHDNTSPSSVQISTIQHSNVLSLLSLSLCNPRLCSQLQAKHHFLLRHLNQG
jgi:hypothetical protein